MRFERLSEGYRDPRLPAEPFVPYTEPLVSEGQWTITGRGTVFGIRMPIVCDRAMMGDKGVLAALGGNPITVNGQKWRLKAVEMFMPATPIGIGESVGLLVEPWSK